MSGGTGAEADTIERWVGASRLRFRSYGAWLAGHEPNVQSEDEYHDAALRVLIVRLTPYETVSSSMSHSLLGQICRSVPGVYVDYCFMPPPEEASAMVSDAIPPLFGTTSKRPFCSFDIIAVSNSVAQELVNLPWLLTHSGIPLDRERRSKDGTPLIIMGGANAQSAFIACPSPSVSKVILVDALYFGEAERQWPKVLEFLRDSADRSAPRDVLLDELSERFESVYVPTCEPSQRRRAVVKDLDSFPPLISAPVWYNEETVGKGSIAIDGGCAFLCAFCKEAWEGRPYRVRSVQGVIGHCDEARRYQGLDTLNLFSFNATSHAGLGRIIGGVQRLGVTPQIKSQRFDLLLRNPECLDYQQISGKSHYTFGLEGISGRLRAFLAKGIEEWQALEAMEMVLSRHVRGIKLFLIITGYEDEQDWKEFDSFLLKIRSVKGRNRRGAGEGPPIVLSATPLISMPGTPMQFNAFPELAVFDEALRRLKDCGRRASMAVRESISPSEAQVAQLMLFSAGEGAEALVRMSEYCQYGHSLPEKAAQHFVRALPAGWVKSVLGPKEPSAVFPWDVVMTAEEKERLYAIYQKCRSLLERGKPDIGKGPGMKGKDGSPDPYRDTGRTGIVTTCADYQGFIESQREVSGKPSLIWLKARISRRCAGFPVSFFQTAAVRMLYLSSEALCSSHIRPGPAFADLERLPTAGIRVFSLAFSGGAVEMPPLSSLQRQWEWELLSVRQSPACDSPSGVLLQIPCTGEETEKTVRAMSKWLGEEKIAHHLERLKGSAVFQIARQSVRKAGCLYARFNYDERSAEIAALTSSACQLLLPSGKGRPGHQSPLAFWRDLGEDYAPSVQAWFFQQAGGRCRRCRSSLLIDAFDGSALCGGLCQFCGSSVV